MEKIDVLYATDDKYIDITLTSALSLICNSGFDKINVHIITSGFKIADYEKVDEILSKYSNVKVLFYPLENYNIEKYNIPSWKGLQTGNARLFFQDIMGDRLNSIENILYLDGDTLVMGNLNSLDEYKDNVVNACKDNLKPSAAKRFGVPIYYNSGVLFINVDRWIKEGMQDKIIEEVIHPSSDLYLPDQNILNCALKGCISELPINYNLMPLEYLFDEKERKKYYNEKLRQRTGAEVSKAVMNPKIYHSCCMVGIKPWTNNTINPYNEEYRKFLFQVNPDFTLEELNSFKKIFDRYPILFKKLLILRNYLPDYFNVVISKLSIYMQDDKKNKKLIL